MSASGLQVNYAHAIGFNSVAAAVIFATLYVPLFHWFILQSFKHPTYVHIVLSLFCAIRITAFVIRSLLASASSAGENLGLLIGDEILFGVGFFGLLYSAYTLVLDRELLNDSPPPRNPIIALTRNRRIFRLALVLAVALGSAGTSMSQSSSSSTAHTGKTLHVISTVMFLVLTILQALQTLHLARSELSGTSQYRKDNESFGMRYGVYILLLVAALLLVREAFSMATVNDLLKQTNEHFWYPLLAVPEIIAVALYATPGLVPPRSDLPK
ncbi:uncharacterized protein LACBIDRAFT_295674 [Laccaria bicolor S238N-H82]|uniref:Predicted protein n=1 Tax=Laccaria bicolor (strain S238N-H82 / ATCC MYA-4686) TaxID=486041 RepID=B0DWZ3_LACBS|nr:uncharacterized protein LACBIDRAFT_295674 [Laccaria bicolor S238N-H82]EDR00897.1 predicted protein [Laccaria bicolor S238N-H82]|eukprot:XP_001888491.1 predicted protein [Laccaria bicolor S238N-H82]